MVDERLQTLVDEFKVVARELVGRMMARAPVIAKLGPIIQMAPVTMLCDVVISTVNASLSERMDILNAVDLVERYRLGIEIIKRQLALMSVSERVADRMEGVAARRHRQQHLEERLKRIQAELRELDMGDPGFDEGADAGDGGVAALELQVARAAMPPEALRACRRELRKLREMEERGPGGAGPEYHKMITYIQCMVDLVRSVDASNLDVPVFVCVRACGHCGVRRFVMVCFCRPFLCVFARYWMVVALDCAYVYLQPWSRSARPLSPPTVQEARRILDRDHFGLERLKQRVLEYVSLRLHKPSTRGAILCFVGPPGTGKTSMGRSIAAALGREFLRIALGGIRDEADIRGFQRTYVGSMPGRIIRGLSKVGCDDPVFLLDEVDKLGSRCVACEKSPGGMVAPLPTSFTKCGAL